MTKIVIPPKPKYDLEVGECKRVVDFKDGYLYQEGPPLGRYVVTIYKSAGTPSLRLVSRWGSKKAADHHMRALLKLDKRHPGYLDDTWKMATKLKMMKEQ